MICILYCVCTIQRQVIFYHHICDPFYSTSFSLITTTLFVSMSFVCFPLTVMYNIHFSCLWVYNIADLDHSLPCDFPVIVCFMQSKITPGIKCLFHLGFLKKSDIFPSVEFGLVVRTLEFLAASVPNLLWLWTLH